MRFVEFKERTYGGRYIKICVNIEDISRIIECKDDYRYTNIVMKDGKIHTINEEYDNVVAEITKSGD